MWYSLSLILWRFLITWYGSTLPPCLVDLLKILAVFNTLIHCPLTSWKLNLQQNVMCVSLIFQGTNAVYQFLSGVPITPQTKFLHLQNPDVLSDYKQVVHYMRYALAAYGWPMYMKMNAGTGLCKIMPELRLVDTWIIIVMVKVILMLKKYYGLRSVNQGKLWIEYYSSLFLPFDGEHGNYKHLLD